VTSFLQFEDHLVPMHRDYLNVSRGFLLTVVYLTRIESRLIGFGCDGTSVNLGANGLRGYLEKCVPWVVSFWYLAH